MPGSSSVYKPPARHAALTPVSLRDLLRYLSCTLLLAGITASASATDHGDQPGKSDQPRQNDSAQQGTAPAWQFTLPSQDGQRFVSLAELRGPVLVNFWGVDCPPCVEELPMLGRYARQHQDWRVLLVNTDGAAPAQRFLESHELSDISALTLLRPGLNISGLMRKAGNLHGVLPYSVAVDSRKAICFRKAGALSQDDLTQIRNSCR